MSKIAALDRTDSQVFFWRLGHNNNECKLMNFIELELQYNNFLNVSKGNEIATDYFRHAELHFHLLLEMRLLPTI